MKRIVAVACLVAGTLFADTTPVMVSLVTPVQAPSRSYDVTGFRLSLIYGDCQDFTGLDIGVAQRAAGTFTGAAGRLQEVCRSESGVAYKDFAHSPSKLKATVHAVREQWRNKRLVAVMELHTFSSLTKDFLPQYHGGMDEADVAMVYYNPKVMEEKRMASFSVADVENAFGGNVRAFDDSEELKKVLRQMAPMEDTALLLMTSGNFNGVNLVEFARELLNNEQ